MEKVESDNNNRFGLVGKNISYSFSKGYFTSKFNDLGLGNHSYDNFDLQDIQQFKELIKDQGLKGLNVTIPYKEKVIPYLDAMDEQAASIGAVNTIKITNYGTKGYNTDAYGFEQSLLPYLRGYHKKALILGTGGAAKAIAYVLDKLGIDYCSVSRKPKRFQIGYEDITQDLLTTYKVLINCSPVGTFPNIKDKPALPYAFIGKQHLLYDLIYNPEKTAFLNAGEKRGATSINGLDMLKFQAEKAWEIWNGP